MQLIPKAATRRKSWAATTTAAATFDSSATIMPSDLAVRASTTIRAITRTQGQVAVALVTSLGTTVDCRRTAIVRSPAQAKSVTGGARVEVVAAAGARPDS